MLWDQLQTIIISFLYLETLAMYFTWYLYFIARSYFFLPKTTIGNQNNNNNKASIPPQSQAKTSNQNHHDKSSMFYGY